MECILIRGVRVIRGQTDNHPLSQSTVRRECVVGAQAKDSPFFRSLPTVCWSVGGLSIFFTIWRSWPLPFRRLETEPSAKPRSQSVAKHRSLASPLQFFNRDQIDAFWT
jgi:hypothetical protein